MEIRPAVLSDTEQIYKMHKASIQSLCSTDYNAKEIAAWVALLSPEIYESAITEKVMIVGEDNGFICGLGILDPDERQISAVYVHPDLKGTGLGRRILMELERRVLERGIDRLSLCATVNAESFYKYQGYKAQGPDFHALSCGTKLECVAMQKKLVRT